MASAFRTVMICVQSTPWLKPRDRIRASAPATPINAPMMQCDELLGMPNAQVSTFQNRAAANSATSIGTAGEPSGGVSTSGGKMSTNA